MPETKQEPERRSFWSLGKTGWAVVAGALASVAAVLGSIDEIGKKIQDVFGEPLLLAAISIEKMEGLISIPLAGGVKIRGEYKELMASFDNGDEFTKFDEFALTTDNPYYIQGYIFIFNVVLLNKGEGKARDCNARLLVDNRTIEGRPADLNLAVLPPVEVISYSQKRAIFAFLYDTSDAVPDIVKLGIACEGAHTDFQAVVPGPAAEYMLGLPSY